jgi:hypothetical protein
MAATELAKTTAASLDATPGVQARSALRRTIHAAIYVYAGLWLLTGLALLASVLAPSFGPSSAPHAALEPTPAAVAGVLLNNAHAVAPAFLLALLGLGNGRISRGVGDVIVTAPLALLNISVGSALGRWGHRLLAYIPQLPVEYAAAAVAASVWITRRRSPRPRARSLAADAGVVLALLAIAAVLEVLTTPHAR